MNDNNTTSERCKWARRVGKADGQASNHIDGQFAEDLAARFLETRGLAVLARNFRCRGGEIDLICRDGDALVFVEVRLRRTESYGGAAASITPAKQRRVILAARNYLAARRQDECACRFDALLLDGKTIEWVRDAFCAD